MPVNLDENTEIESLIQQPAVESQHGRWTRMALALLAAAAGVAALAGYHATGPGHASQSISVMQLTENDECEKLTDSMANCPYVRWHHTISKSNSHVDLTCVPKRARTKGKTCKEWCEQGTLGYVCLRGQDNQGGAKHNQCVANKNHDNRGKSADNNGCDQSWGDQICQCGKVHCHDAFSCATEKTGRYGHCNAEEKRRCPKACKVCS